MKCAYHSNVDAVATCNVCGKALCQTCASMIKPPQCIGCYRDSLIQRKSDIRDSLIKDILIGIVTAVILTFLFEYTGSTQGNVLFNALMCALIPFGWRFLNKITPNMFLFLPFIGWLVYFFCKFALSAMIGMFVTPYVIWKKCNDMKQVQKLIDDVGNMDNRSLVA